MICTARTTYRAKPISISAWIAWNKLLAHLRMFHVKNLAGDSEGSA
jgi:hypothetical protein